MCVWAGPNGAVIAPELVNEAMAAASLVDVLLKLTGEAGFTFVEPIVRCACPIWLEACLCFGSL